MRKYETVFISDPDLSDQARSDLSDKVRNIIANEKGILIDFDEWGNKKLAYEIKKKLRGNYVCATYGGNGNLVNELERNFRLTDDALKFMTIVLSEDQPEETFEKEAELAAQKPKESEPVSEETAEDDSAPEAEKTDEKTVEDNSDDSAETAEEPEAADETTDETQEKA